MKKFFRRIIREFVRQQYFQGASYGDYNRVVIALYFTIICIIGITSFVILDYYSGLTTFLISDLTFLALYFLILLLMQEGLFITAKYLVVICTIAGVSVGGLAQGREAGNYLLFFPTTALLFMMFSTKQLKHIIILLCYIVSALLVLEISDYQLFSLGTISREYQSINHIMSLTSSMLVIILSSYNLMKLYNAAELKLERLNIRLSRQNKELKKTNTELDSFVYKASHDLRAPLTSVLGLISISREENDLNKIREYMVLKEKAVHKLDNYIQQVLFLSRNARSEVSIEKFNIRSLIEDIFEQLSYMPQAKSIKHKVTCKGGEDCYSDSKRLHMIFSNLISNSYHYYNPYISDPTLEINIEIDSKEVLIKLSDNGKGIEEKHLPHIFEMFYRGNEAKPGSGLGLYIVRETTKMLRGNITVVSTPNAGTTFTLRIPNSL